MKKEEDFHVDGMDFVVELRYNFSQICMYSNSNIIAVSI